MEFRIARFDKIAIIVTVFVTVLLVVMSVFFIIRVPYGWAFAIGMMLIALISYLLSPRRYYFEGSKLIIEKVIGKRIIIELNDIEGCTLVSDFTKLRIARIFGNGGLYGYYGMFSSAEYGNINCQLKNLKNVFIIKSKRGNFALSPLEPLKFEEYFKNAVSGIKGKIEKIEPITLEGIIYASPSILIIPVVIFVLTVVMLFALYPQLPERIAVHFDYQGNPDRWANKTSFLSSGIIPAAILFVLNIVMFFVIRKTTTKSVIPNLLVLIFSFIQIFVAYVSFDTYWINKYSNHLIPFPYNIFGFIIIIAALLLFYYRKIKINNY